MPLLYIDKELGTFDATHQLQHHNGKCRNLHGHTYKVACKVIGVMNNDSSRPDFGMILDFSVLKDLYKQLIDGPCDHAIILGEQLPNWYLNSIADRAALRKMSPEEARAEFDAEIGKVTHLPIPTTTAEHLAGWAFNTLRDGLKARLGSTEMFFCTLQEVTVWETPTSSATVSQYWTDEDLFRYASVRGMSASRDM